MGVVHRWEEPLVPRWVSRTVIAVALVTYVIPGLFSSYRAWVQVANTAAACSRGSSAIEPGAMRSTAS